VPDAELAYCIVVPAPSRARSEPAAATDANPLMPVITVSPERSACAPLTSCDAPEASRTVRAPPRFATIATGGDATALRGSTSAIDIAMAQNLGIRVKDLRCVAGREIVKETTLWMERKAIAA